MTGVKVVAACGAAVLLASLFLRIGARLFVGGSWIIIAPSIIVGYLGADFFTGTVHWFCDTFFDEETPFLGPVLITPFRDHHREPGRITEYGCFDQDGSNYIMMIPLLLGSWWVDGPTASAAGSLFIHAGILGFAFGACGTNLFHKWAHSESVPPIVHWLQRFRMILQPDHHQIHHRGDHREGYCVTSGWMNLILDRIGFFPRLERAIRGVTQSSKRMLWSRFARRGR